MATRGTRYNPPGNVTEVAFSKLLAFAGRDSLEQKQMDFLRSDANTDVTKGGKVFVAGDETLLERRCIAVIGARKATDNGRRRARQLGRQLAEAGVVVVSGLAEGIDTEALTGAIDAGGKVIAVIGTPN